MTQKAFFSVSVFLGFCKKKTRENVVIDFFQFILKGDGKKPIAILEFYKLNLNKGKCCTV
jgi:hypothetical protein